MDSTDQDVRKCAEAQGSQTALQLVHWLCTPIPPLGKDSVISFLPDGVCVALETKSTGRSPAEVHAENKASHSEVYLSKK